jgi:hypothetical protein
MFYEPASGNDGEDDKVEFLSVYICGNNGKALLILFSFAAQKQGCQIFLGKPYKNGKIYQMAIEYIKMPYNIPNSHKIDQMAIKYANIFH